MSKRSMIVREGDFRLRIIDNRFRQCFQISAKSVDKILIDNLRLLVQNRGSPVEFIGIPINLVQNGAETLGFHPMIHRVVTDNLMPDIPLPVFFQAQRRKPGITVRIKVGVDGIVYGVKIKAVDFIQQSLMIHYN